MNKFFATSCCALLLHCATAQAQQLDLFIGPEVLHKDTEFTRVYELVVNLNPGFRWQMGRQWELAGQVTVPVYNDYGGRYKRIRPTMLTLSKTLKPVGEKHYFRLSGGLFTHERYGVDAKWFCPLNAQWALSAEGAFTGFCSMAADWECSTLQRWMAVGAVHFYEPKYRLQMKVQGGRFIRKDVGVLAECLQHYRHVSVGAYLQYTDLGKENMGVKVIVDLPPYKQRKAKKVNLRLAESFRFLTTAKAESEYGQTPYTDPEENERVRNFHPGWMEQSGKEVTP